MMADDAWRIVGWSETFENSASRKLVKLAWVATPNRHDGAGFRRLLRKGGPEAYAAWMMIVQVASRCTERGVLHNGQRALTADDLADKTGLEADLFEHTLKLLSDPSILWVEGGPNSPLSAATSGESADASGGSGGYAGKKAQGKEGEKEGIGGIGVEGLDRSEGEGLNIAAAPPAGTSPRKTKTPRKPDPIWDKLAELFFPDGVPTGDNTRLGRVVRDLKQMKATPEEIDRRSDEYRKTMPDMPLTLEGLRKNYGRLGNAQKQPMTAFERLTGRKIGE